MPWRCCLLVPDAVMISPVFHEGLDLYDERCRFQVIPKVPYGYIGDPVVNARRLRDRDYYQIMAIQKLVQACGRAVRSETDFADTYILDVSFRWLFYTFRHYFPRYIWEAIRQQQ